jgi:YidC/Oxa1 family membrane protein insertase
MKMMNNVMPFVSGLMCFMFPIGVGIYWVAGNVFRICQSFGINLYFNKMDMNEEIQKNIEKSKKRYEKMGIDPNSSMKDLQNQKKETTGNKKKEKSSVNVSQVTKNRKKSDYKRPESTDYKEGSIAAYANMLNRNTSSKDEK